MEHEECRALARVEEKVKNLQMWQEKQNGSIQDIQCEIKKIHLQVQAQTVKLAFIVGVSQVLLAAFLRHYLR